MTNRELLTMALEALEGFVYHGRSEIWTEAIAALRARLAEPEPKPVAWVVESHEVDAEGKPLTLCTLDWNDFDVDQLPVGTRLYTAPPTRRPLTDEEIDALWRDTVNRFDVATTPALIRAFARAIERAHGIGGNDE